MEKSDSTWQVSIMPAWIDDPTLIARTKVERMDNKHGTDMRAHSRANQIMVLIKWNTIWVQGGDRPIRLPLIDDGTHIKWNDTN